MTDEIKRVLGKDNYESGENQAEEYTFEQPEELMIEDDSNKYCNDNQPIKTQEKSFNFLPLIIVIIIGFGFFGIYHFITSKNTNDNVINQAIETQSEEAPVEEQKINEDEEEQIDSKAYNDNEQEIQEEQAGVKEQPIVNKEVKSSTHIETTNNTQEIQEPQHSISINNEYKIYVGQYATELQAKSAKDIMSDSFNDISPVIKNIGNGYTIQIGTYDNRFTAETMLNKLKQMNLPARIVE